MKALIFILSYIAFAGACLPSTWLRPVPKDYVFKCAPPNGKGLQDVFGKVAGTIYAWPPVVSDIGYFQKVNQWLLEAINEGLKSLYEENVYNTLLDFMCENVYVDAQFYVENLVAFANWEKTEHANTVYEVPEEKYAEGFSNLTDLVRNSVGAKNAVLLISEAVKTDPYAQLGMDYITSPKFDSILKKVLSLPQLSGLMEKLQRHKFNMDDVLYFYQMFAIGWWAREETDY